MEDLLLIIPIISIAIATLLAKLFIFSLFYPTNKKRMFGIEVQGLIYFYKEKLIRDLANFLEKEINKELPKRLNKEIDSLEINIREKTKVFIKKKLEENKKKINLPDYAFYILESLILKLIDDLSIELKGVIKEKVNSIEKEKMGTKVKSLIWEYANKISNEQIKNYIEKTFSKFLDLIVVYSATLGLIIGIVIDILLLIFLV
jgi:hypothetical protein